MKTRRNFLKLMLAIPVGLVLGKVDLSAENIISNVMKSKISGKKNIEKNFTLWQLHSQGPTQMLSYVIKSANGKIIVIDGGMTCDGDYLKKFLASHGNHVDCWFLTHPHEDHIDALTWILSNQGDLKIDKIYASFPPLEWIKKYENGNTHTHEEFNTALKKSDRKYIEIKRGDAFDVDGIHIEILSNVNLDITFNAINNSSIVMKFSDENKSVLFLGDLGVEGGDKLLKSIDHKKLKADYVQMAHHGQGGVRKNFYEVVQPEYCLWPTPLWLWTNADGKGKFGTLEVRKWMKDLKVKKNYVSGFGMVEIY
ncbi:MBL fold metallo-hydrolase [bacterium]|nr:MBL fold metallo-hydrolase [bacterium]